MNRIVNVQCEHCGFVGDLEAETVPIDELAWFTCPSTQCERNDVGEQCVPWFDESGDDRQGDR